MAIKVKQDQRIVTVNRNRYGYEIDGEFLRRVTTHLRGIPKPWLGRWAAKEVATWAVENQDKWLGLEPEDAIGVLKKKPWDKRDEAGDRGTAVHNAIEAYVNDEPLPDGMTEDEFDCAVAAEAFLRGFVGQVLAAELTVYSWTHDYAGTLDLWAVDRDGTRWILDWKTSKDVYTDHAVQQVAYQRAEHAVVEKTEIDDEEWEGTSIEWGPHRAERLGIVHVTPEGASLHEIRLDHTDRLWTVFRAAKHMKSWQKDTDDYRGDPDVPVYEEPVAFSPEDAEAEPATAKA